MRKIVQIEHIEERKDKQGKTYFRTHAVLDDGSKVIGFGKEFDLDDAVESFYDIKFDTHKMRKTKLD